MPDPSEQAPVPSKTGAEVVAIREGADGWGVVTVTSPDGAFQKEPCTRCPWRRDAPIGAFPPEVFRLSASTTYDLATKEFGCHASKRGEPKTCAGFLLRGAAHNLTVRMYGPDVSEVTSKPTLYDTYREMAIANGVDSDDPVLAGCRDSRPFIDTDGAASPADHAVAADQAAATVSRAGRLVREFIVESAGLDVGEAMTADAVLLAGRLAAAGHLESRGHPQHAGDISALEMIRQFIVDCVGEDLGEDTTDVAEQLRSHLAATGVLAAGVFEPMPLQPEQA